MDVERLPLTLSSLILVGGSLGDIFGERRMFVLRRGRVRRHVAVLRAGAHDRAARAGARASGRRSGALLTPAALAVITSTFPPEERGKAIGAWTAWGGIGTVLGPLIGGQLVESASWRWIFAINIPVVAITLVLVTRVMVPAGRGGADARVDYVGALLCAFGLAGIDLRR